MFGQAVALADGVGEPWTHEFGVGNRGLVHVAGVVFAPDQRQVRLGRRLDLLMHMLHRAANHLIARNIFVGAENVAGVVIGIDVSRDKVQRARSPGWRAE